MTRVCVTEAGEERWEEADCVTKATGISTRCTGDFASQFDFVPAPCALSRVEINDTPELFLSLSLSLPPITLPAAQNERLSAPQTPALHVNLTQRGCALHVRRVTHPTPH